MQANNDQKWTDDGAFWDEAWADMELRLDENPVPRRGLAWWWYAGAFLALLLVVTPLVVTGVFNPEVRTQTGTTPPVSTPLKAPAPQPASPPDSPGTQGDVPATPSASAKEAFVGNPAKDQQAESSVVAQRLPSRPPAGRRPSVKTSGFTVLTMPPGEPASLPRPSVTLPDPRHAENPVAEVAPRVVPPALNALTPSGPDALPLAPTVLPAVNTGKSRWANAFALEAGLLAPGAAQPRGFYAGAGYLIRLSRRWSVPVAVRYRREAIPLAAFPISTGESEFVSNPSSDLSLGQDSVIVNSVRGDAAVDLSSATLVTEAIETRLGLNYALTPRLRVGSGLAAAYLWRADLRFRATTLSDNSNLENTANLLRRGNSSDFSQGFNGTTNNVTAGRLPDIDPLHLRTYLELDYTLSPRLDLTAGGSLLLRPTDLNETTGVPSGRAYVGLRWRLR